MKHIINNKILASSVLALALVFVVGLAGAPAAHAQDYNNYPSYGSYNNGYSNGGYYGTPVYNYNIPYNPPPQQYSPPLQASCYPTPLSIQAGQTAQWMTSISGGNGVNNISWTGDEGLSGQGSSISKTYYNSGYKNASITVSSAGQTISANCSGSVNVSNPIVNYNPAPIIYNNPAPIVYNNPAPIVYNNPAPIIYNNPAPIYNYTPFSSNNSGLDIGCYADPATASINQPVTWNVEVVGGAAPYTYSWTGSDGLTGTRSSIIKYYNSYGQKNAIVIVSSADGRTGTRACTNAVTVRRVSSGVVTPAAKAAAPAVQAEPAPQNNNGLSAAALFSLDNIPWGWVIILIILILFGTVMYLLFNRPRI